MWGSVIRNSTVVKGTLCLHIAGELAVIYNDSQFAALFPRRGNPLSRIHPRKIDFRPIGFR
jgi:hypothetical protein